MFCILIAEEATKFGSSMFCKEIQFSNILLVFCKEFVSVFENSIDFKFLQL